MRICPLANTTFKANNCVVGNLAKAADKMHIQGKDDKEKAINLLEEKCTFKILGSGGTSIVYEIPYTHYALRTPLRNAKNMTEFETTQLSNQEKLNNILAKDKEHNCRILKRIDGLHNNKVPYNENLDDFCTIVSNMSQKAYDDYLEKIVEIHKNGLFLDTYGDNMIIDIINQRFEPIDLMNINSCSNYKHSLYPVLKFNPIDCMFQGIYNSIVVHDYLLFFAKCAKSLAKDCKNFTYFDYNIDSSCKIEKDERLKEFSRDLYEKLIRLHKTKMLLARKGGVSEAEIQEKMKPMIDDYIKIIDEQILQDEDLPVEELLKLQKRIEDNSNAKDKKEH